MRQIWIPFVMALAIAGCTSGTREERIEDIAATWRHQDGTPVTATEYAQARIDCERSSQRAAAPPDTTVFGNPAYHPGGAGLLSVPPSAGFLSPVGSPSSTRVGEGAIPLGDCLRSKGFVRADAG